LEKEIHVTPEEIRFLIDFYRSSKEYINIIESKTDPKYIAVKQSLEEKINF
jgi:hypothetical protein